MSFLFCVLFLVLLGNSLAEEILCNGMVIFLVLLFWFIFFLSYVGKKVYFVKIIKQFFLYCKHYPQAFLSKLHLSFLKKPASAGGFSAVLTEF